MEFQIFSKEAQKRLRRFAKTILGLYT